MTPNRRWLLCALSLLAIPIAFRGLQAVALQQHGRGLEAMFEDDFFYYTVVARRLLHGGMLSFDGIHETNGFHPLWFAVVCGVELMSTWMRVSPLLLCWVLTSLVLPMWGAMELQRVLRAQPDASPHVAAAFALLYGVCAFQVSFGGMEVALTLALAPRFFGLARALRTGPWALFAFSLWGALVVLSRLDSVLVVGPVWLAAVVRAIARDRRQVEARIRVGAALAATLLGWLPLLGYLGANLLRFGALLPESAQAKAITVEPGPFWNTLASFGKAPTTMALGALGLAVAVTALLIARSARPARPLRFEWLYACLWPLAFYALLSLRSPWGFWAWYLYPIVMALPPLALLLQESAPRQAAPRWRALVATVALLGVAVVAAKEGARVVRGTPPNSVFEGALGIKRFADQHPGYYAMGDRAGMVGHFLQSPVLQLEGLVGGRHVLTAIAAQRPLLSFLEDAGVDYYVGTNLERDAQGCLVAIEPAQGRRGAAHMVDRLCEPPVFAFSVAGYRTTIHRVSEAPVSADVQRTSAGVAARAGH